MSDYLRDSPIVKYIKYAVHCEGNIYLQTFKQVWGFDDVSTVLDHKVLRLGQ